MLSWSLLPPKSQSFLSAPQFDPEGISYMICGAGQTDRSCSASGQFYCAPDICSQFNTLPQLQLQLSEKTYLDLELFAIVLFLRTILFPYSFCRNFLDRCRFERDKKRLNPSPLQTSSQSNGDGEGKDTLPHTSPPPSPSWSFLDCNFIYFPLFLS